MDVGRITPLSDGEEPWERVRRILSRQRKKVIKEALTQAVEAIVEERNLLREFYAAMEAVEADIAEFEVHDEAVTRLRRAHNAVRRYDGKAPAFPEEDL